MTTSPSSIFGRQVEEARAERKLSYKQKLLNREDTNPREHWSSTTIKISNRLTVSCTVSDTVREDSLLL